MKPVMTLLLAACACAHGPAAMDDARSLADAESAFAAHSVREDMRAAFIAHFAPGGLFVRDGWTVARDFLAPRPPPPITLDWRPAYVEVAASGELGLSTGPWRLRPKDRPDAPEAFGQFVSVWRRDAAGAWKVIVDLGIGNPGAALWDAPLAARLTPGAARPGAGIQQAERAFHEAFARRGPAAAYAEFAAEDLRFYREGRAPATSRAAALQAIASEAAGSAWVAEDAQAARSADLGFARGSVSAPGASRASGYYLRVWRHEAAGWRIVLDVVQPAPRA